MNELRKFLLGELWYAAGRWADNTSSSSYSAPYYSGWWTGIRSALMQMGDPELETEMKNINLGKSFND